MSNINELAIGDSTVSEKIVKQYGTFKLQDKDITENGKHCADVGFNGIRLADVNVSGGGGSVPTTWYLWEYNSRFGGSHLCYLPFNVAPESLLFNSDLNNQIDLGSSGDIINKTSHIVKIFLTEEQESSYHKEEDEYFTIYGDIVENDTTYSLVNEYPYYISPTAYAWSCTNSTQELVGVLYTNFNIAPIDIDAFKNAKVLIYVFNDLKNLIRISNGTGADYLYEGETYERDSNAIFKLISDSETYTYTRDYNKDLSIW